MGSFLEAKRTAAGLRRRLTACPKLAIVLGSGFGDLAETIDPELEIPYANIPGFPRVTVSGHSAKLIVGQLGGLAVVALCGRAHYYEGHSLARVTFPIRALSELGVETVLLTNAAGGINRRFRAGDFMCLSDHINLMGVNPLRGPGFLAARSRFVDLSRAYDAKLRQLLKRAADQTKVRLHHGVYVAVTGPSYETPAEVRALARLGADAVGMSTVPETIIARQCGLRVAAVSCITNPAARRGTGQLSHEEVLSAAQGVGGRASRLLKQFARLYGESSADLCS